MKHIVIKIKDLMYKGCEEHWGCVICSECVPFHCYKKDEFEQLECKGLNDLTFDIPKDKKKYVKMIRSRCLKQIWWINKVTQII